MEYVEKLDLIRSAMRSPPVNVEKLVGDLGLELRYAFLDDEISGMIEAEGDSYTITINADDAPTRMRFTIAHELGHYMRHRDLIGSGLDDNKAYRSTSKGKYANYAVGPKQEREANKFAADVLMPYSLVVKYLKEQRSVQEMAELFNVSEAAMSIRKGHVEKLMDLRGSE